MIDSAGEMPAALDHRLIHNDDIQSGFTSRKRCIEPGGAAADDQNIGL
jgi:hypothetical protein